MTSHDEERWEKLFSSIEELTKSNNRISSEIQMSNQRMDSMSQKLFSNERRITKIEREFSSFAYQQRLKNIVLFKLEDTAAINNNLFAAVLNIFAQVGLEIPDLSIDDIFRLGKVPGNRPVLIKFTASRWVRDVFTKINEIKKLNYIVANDRSKEEREMRRQLLSKIFKLRDAGQDVSLRGNKIFLNGSTIITKEKLDSMLTTAMVLISPDTPRASQPSTYSTKTKTKKRGRSTKESLLDHGKSQSSKKLENYFSPRVSVSAEAMGVKKQRTTNNKDSPSEL